MHPRKYFTLNFLSMKYFLSKNFRTTVYIMSGSNMSLDVLSCLVLLDVLSCSRYEIMYVLLEAN